MVFTMPRVSGDLERRGEEGGREGGREGGTVSGQSFQPAYQPASLPSTRRRRIATLSLWRGRNLEWRFCWTLRPDTGGTRSAETPRLSDGNTLCFQK